MDPFFFWLLLVGCCLLLALLLGHIAWTVKRTVFFRRQWSEKSSAADEHRGQLSLSYRQEALRRAAEGNFTEAIRCLFLSLIYRFDESGRVNYQQAYTNREYLALFADRPPVHRPLKVFVDMLDDYWYGQRPTERGQYEECLALYQGLTTA